MVLAQRETYARADDGADRRPDRIRGDRRRLRRLLQKDAREGRGGSGQEDRDQAGERNVKPELAGEDDRDAKDRECGRPKLSRSESLHAESRRHQRGRERDGRVENRRDATRDHPLAPVKKRKIDAEVEDPEKQGPAQGPTARKALARREDQPGKERCSQGEA